MTQTVHRRPTAIQTIDQLLDDQRRRHALVVLAGREPPVSLAAVARAVGARETGEAPADVPPAVLEEIQLTLHHVHLPWLADADEVALAYDPEERTVERATVDAIAAVARAVDDIAH